jgi:Tfp pilus assembly protein PilN
MRALDLNLASRPFRNNTPLWAGHAALLAGVLLFGSWNVRTYLRAVENLEALQADIGSVERQLAALDRRDQDAQRAAREFDLKTLQVQADEANEIILRRGLSWTRLFNQLEKVVPYEVRATAVRPIYGTREAAAARNTPFEGVVPIGVEGLAQSLEAFLEFERALIMDPHFSGVEPLRTESTPGANEVRFELRFLYDPEGRLGGEHPDIPHVLDAARKADEEGGEAPPSALKGLP